MRLRLVKQPFDNPDYIFELKHDDGFRAVVYVENGECRLLWLLGAKIKFTSWISMVHQ